MKSTYYDIQHTVVMVKYFVTLL